MGDVRVEWVVGLGHSGVTQLRIRAETKEHSLTTKNQRIHGSKFRDLRDFGM